MIASRDCAEAAVQVQSRRRSTRVPTTDQRAERAEQLVRLVELSAARMALEGDPIASGSDATLQALRDPRNRPYVPREPLPREVHQPEGVIELDQERFLRNLRSARPGAAGGPSGMTAEHLRPLLDSHGDGEKFWRVCEGFGRVEMPLEVLQALRIGRMTALQKPIGVVAGIVVGDFVRRLVARTLAQQLGPAVESATEPFQFAVSSREGSECVAHVAQALTDKDDSATLLPVDPIDTFDLVSRGSMMSGSLEVEGGASALFFVRQFYGSPSSNLWDDDDGVTHGSVRGQ